MKLIGPTFVICKHRLEAILNDNDSENECRLEHFYKVGDQVMLKKDSKT